MHLFRRYFISLFLFGIRGGLQLRGVAVEAAALAGEVRGRRSINLRRFQGRMGWSSSPQDGAMIIRSIDIYRYAMIYGTKKYMVFFKNGNIYGNIK